MITVARMIPCLIYTALVALPAVADVARREVNDGNLVLEDVPEIPAALVATLNRYQNVRSARFLDWAPDGAGLYISTRFGDVSQVHRVDRPGAARTQLTFFAEPVGDLHREPDGGRLLFTMDAGGSEFAQIFMLPGPHEEAILLTDGKSRNGAVVWDRRGGRIAYQSTRRNGASNDVWVMDVDNPETARMVYASPDGTWWGGVDFSAEGGQLLIFNYVGNMDSRIHLLDLNSGGLRRLAGDPGAPSSNYPVAFDRTGAGFWYTSDAGGEFRRLAWQSLAEGAGPQWVSGDLDWHVEGVSLSEDRTRGAFTVNENGFSRLYLLDPVSREYRSVSDIPLGVISGMQFSRDGRALAMTISTAQAPGDSFVLELGVDPLDPGRLVRWTYSEAGGLDTAAFVSPELVHFPTFDLDGDAPRQVPAWLFRPEGKGPLPVIIDIHGGPEGQARPTFSSVYQMWIRKLGVALIRPNVRGSSGYGKTYRSLDNGFLREDSVRDIGALLEWIGTRPDLDAGRVAVVGGSYGGYMVLASAVHYSDRLRAAVDRVGISNFVTFLQNTQDYRRDLRRAEYGDERDPDMRAHLEKISPLNSVDRITVPLLVVQGQNDPRVPVTESQQLVAALRAQGRPVWYMNAMNEGHGYRKKENRDVYEQATVLFLERYLLGD